MPEFESRLNISWQLVSQFVSWDFCRYMCEESLNVPSETDVLTFLRNMIVPRTKKGAADITKHEIVAKFIMETRRVQSKSSMPCIIALSETVVRICPELKPPMLQLLHHLENLLNVLEWNEDSQKDELILTRIAQAVNEFIAEAVKLLPLPDLLQVVKSWIPPELQFKVWNTRQNDVANAELYQRVVNCLQKEIITPFEVRTIALALYQDKALEKIIIAETEVEGDSQQNSSNSLFQLQPQTTLPEQSLHLSSQPCLTQEKQHDSNVLFTLDPEQSLDLFSQPCLTQEKQHDPSNVLFTMDPEQSLDLSSQPCLTLEKLHDSNVLFTLEDLQSQSLRHQSQFIQSSIPISQNSLDPCEESRLTEGIPYLGPLNPIETYLFQSTVPQPLFSTLSPKDNMFHGPQICPENSPLGSSNNRVRQSLGSVPLPNKVRERSTSPGEQFYTAPFVPNDPSDDSNLPVFSPAKIVATNKRRKKFVHFIDSDVDLFEDVDVLQVSSYDQASTSKRLSGSDSDCEINSEFRFLTPTCYRSGPLEHHPPTGYAWPSDDGHNDSSISSYPTNSQIKDPTFYIQGSTSITSLSPPQTRLKTKTKKKKLLDSPKFNKTPMQATLKGFGFSSSTRNQNTISKVAEKKRFKLFDNDAFQTDANESALFQKSNTRKKPNWNKMIENLGRKRRCWECRKTFRTTILLKKHIFMQHISEDLDSTEELF